MFAKTMHMCMEDGGTYCKMSNSSRNLFSVGLVEGASGLLKSKFGMPSWSVATAKSSRNLRLRDDAIELQRVNIAYHPSKRSEK